METFRRPPRLQNDDDDDADDDNDDVDVADGVVGCDALNITSSFCSWSERFDDAAVNDDGRIWCVSGCIILLAAAINVVEDEIATTVEGDG